jgi:putative CocE/NonD family hydrolase
MKNRTSQIAVVFLIVVVVAVALFFLYKRQAGREKVSRFGKYQGYSEAVYDGNERRSEYLTLSNGTKLAYDLYLPTKKGVPADKPLPVLFKYTPYTRAFTIFDKDGKNIIADLFNLGWKEKAYLRVRYWFDKRGNLMDAVFRTKYLERMLKHGYAVIVVERPGTGASFGVMNASFEVGAKEVDKILNWIAAQNWCDGNIGMYGDSFQAMIQFSAATTRNPHLKALFPTSSGFDLFSSVNYPGGMLNKTFASFFSWATSFMESGVLTPVDSDKDGSLLAQARRERSGSTLGKQSEAWFREFPFHDSTTPGGMKVWEGAANLYPFLDRINQSNIPIYMTNGWYDLFSGASDMFLWYVNLTVPKRLLVRPADHSEVEKNQFDLDFGAEAHRWFDYWLKGIDNGVMKESPIYYYVMGGPKKDAWRTSSRWPLANQKLTRFYFGDGKTGSIASINDGLLWPKPPDKDAADAYTVDYSTTSGKYSRWYAVNWPRNYPDMQTNDKKALTYTTSPLEADVLITGHPAVHLWFVTDAADLDFFVYLEDVKGSKSTYITEGNLRASHRALSEAPFNNLGLPYHRHYKSDLTPIPAGKPVELVFNLLPTSYLFRAGNRIRITVTCADADNFETPALDPVPKIRLLRDAAHASSVEFPIIQGP